MISPGKDNQVPDNIAIAILAGGQSRRMAGVNKALVAVAGRPMLSYVLNSAKKQSDLILLNTNQPVPTVFSSVAKVVADGHGQGPLAGISASLAWLQKNRRDVDWLVSFSCDCPFIPTDTALRLVQQSMTENASCCYAVDSTGKHYVIAAWSIRLLTAMQRALHQGDYSVHAFLSSVDCCEAYFATPNSHVLPSYFYNVNTPAELKELERMLNNNGDQYE